MNKLLIIFLLIPFIAFSQYPKKMVVNGDTIVALSPENVDSVNVGYIDHDKCKENLKEARVTSIKYRKLIDDGKIIESKRDSLDFVRKKTIEIQDDRINKQNRQLFISKLVNKIAIPVIAVLTLLYTIK